MASYRFSNDNRAVPTLENGGQNRENQTAASEVASPQSRDANPVSAARGRPRSWSSASCRRNQSPIPRRRNPVDVIPIPPRRCFAYGIIRGAGADGVLNRQLSAEDQTFFDASLP